MKKLLLSLATVALGLTASAGEVVFNFTATDAAETYGLPAYDAEAQDAAYVTVPKTITSGDVTLTLNSETDENGYTGWRMWSDGLREYNKRNPSFTVATTNGENVVYVSWTSNSATFALEGTEENILGWEGSESEVTFVNTTDGNKAVYNITVGYGDYEGPEIDPTPEAPTGVISVAEAISLIDQGYTGDATIKGYITQIDSYNSNYGSITYWIADTQNGGAVFEVYSGLSLDKEKFASIKSIEVGALVEVAGSIKKYDDIYEFNYNNYLVSYLGPNGETAPAGPSIEAPEGTITVAEALELMEEGYEGKATVEGVIISITEISTSYGNATYTIADSATETTGLLVYRGYGLNGEKFTSEDEIVVGATVTVSGQLVNYNGTYEFTSGSQIDKYTAPTVTPEGPEGPEGTITVAEALELMEEGYFGVATVEGIITEITEVSVQYGNATYTIKDSVEDEDGIVVFRGYALEGDKFTAEDEIAVGATVVVKGTLSEYNGTYELTNSEIVEYTEPENTETPEPEGPEAPEGIISVEEAVQLINDGYEGAATVTGVISEIVSFNEAYGDMNYYITDEDGEVSLYVYNGLGLEGAEFTSIEDLEVGAVVVIEGNLTEYQGTPEFARGSKIVSYTAPAGGDDNNGDDNNGDDNNGEDDGPTGSINSLDSDNAKIEYYNLQGLKVNSPAKGGLYIIRQGDKTSKVVVR